MIKVSEAVCESTVGQFTVAPDKRMSDIVARMLEENPEFVHGIGSLFQAYIDKNIENGANLSSTDISILYVNAVTFSSLAWSMLQAQAESDAMA